MVGKETPREDLKINFILMLCMFGALILAGASVVYKW